MTTALTVTAAYLAGAATTATPLTRCVLALAPFERDWLARKDPR